jgi:hypothetical protein
MGLEGMIEDVIIHCDFPLNGTGVYKKPMTLGELKDVRQIARKITNAENGIPAEKHIRAWDPSAGNYRNRWSRQIFRDR